MNPKLFGLFVVLAVAARLGNAQARSEICGENESYRECGTFCEPTCAEPTPTCIKMCSAGCKCNPNHFRENGKCVPATSCPADSIVGGGHNAKPIQGAPKCAANEGVKHCSGCEPSCDQPAPFCTKICRQLNICECLPGKYRNNATGSCVEALECPENSAARRIHAVQKRQACPANEELRTCPGCESNCAKPEPQMCPMICREGQACECIAGYSRNAQGKCVLRSECPPIRTTREPTSGNLTCGANERETQCSGCEATCGNLDRMCPLMCNMKPACECAPGFARDPATKTCVARDQCPPSGNLTCGANELETQCSGCEATCGNLDRVCPLMCNMKPACECAPGFARDPATKKCVARDQCPKSGNLTCGENEHETPCSGCEPTCENPDIMCKMMCNNKPACQCSSGFARDSKTKKCVAVEKCPSSGGLTCGKNEKEVQCSGCEATCGNLDRMCAEICNMKPACECAAGFARDPATKKCVARDQCPSSGNLTCGENEQQVQCSGCEANCDNPDLMCDMMCNMQPACQCAPDFYRDSKTKKCVPRDECPAPRPVRDGQKCPKNEKWTECGTCEGTCDNPDPMCTFECKPAGCYCNKPNFVRGSRGHCIHKSICKNRRKRNETREDGLTNLCAATSCPVGTTCEQIPTNCLVAPCPPAPVQCVPVTPQQDDPIPEDPPTNPCAAMLCPANTKCQQVQINCFVPPCPSSIAECVPLTSQQDDPLPEDPPIIRNPICERSRCGFGPCLPVAINCTTLDQCEYIGQCINRTANGADFDVCENSTCPSGSKCDAQVIQCFAPPCLNIPRCVPDTAVEVNDPCDALNCSDDQTCEKAMVKCMAGANCPPIARCVTKRETPENDPCATIRCGNGQMCTKIYRSCIQGSGPCPPIGICVNQTEEDPCALTDCRSGMICVKQEVQCIRAPCNPIAACVEPSRVSTAARKARDVDAVLPHPVMSCDNVRCPANTKCTVLAINCLRTPCVGSRPHCVPINNPSESSDSNSRVARGAAPANTDR